MDCIVGFPQGGEERVVGDAVRFLPVAGGGGGPGGCHGREAPAGAADGIGERVAQREGGQAFGLALAAAHAAAGQGGFGALPVDGLADVLDCGVGGGVLMALIVVMSVLLECVIGEGLF